MQAEKHYLKCLLEQYLSGNYSEEDLEELLGQFQLDRLEYQLKDLIADRLAGNLPTVDVGKVDRILKRLDATVLRSTRPVTEIGEEPPASENAVQRRLFYRLTIATAAAVLLVVTVFYFTSILHRGDRAPIVAEAIEPGGNRAYLTIDEGTVIQLSEDRQGIAMTDDHLVYDDGSLVAPNLPSQQLVLYTPRAGQYRVVLPDGTKVWLNAASRLEYPTDFPSDARMVSLEGEAYFEVAPDPSRPFHVRTARKLVEVLGTKFNMQVYDNEPQHQTTLMEGSVSVISNERPDESIVLRPDQQLRVSEQGVSVADVDASEYRVWTQGLVLLNNYDLAEVLRQLERWYDVEFEDLPLNIRGKRVFGSLQKDVPLQDVLQSLEKNYGLKFTVNERRVHIAIDQD